MKLMERIMQKKRLFLRVYITFAIAAATLPGSPRTEPLSDRGEVGARVDLQKLLPRSGEVRGWIRDGEPLRYDAMDLWEYIDGSAEVYLAYDFRRLIVQDFVSQGGKSLKVEIYEHAKPVDAFGIYSMYRDPSARFLEIGNEAFADDYCLHSWKGCYYIHICVFEKDSILSMAMADFAKAVAARIKDETSLPSWVSAFPDTFSGGVAKERSLSYIRGGILGRGWYPPAFSMEYSERSGKKGVSGAKVYLSRLAGEDDARSVEEKMIGSLSTLERLSLLPVKSLETFAGEDKYLGKVFVSRYKAWVLVATGFPSSSEAFSGYLKELIARLP